MVRRLASIGLIVGLILCLVLPAAAQVSPGEMPPAEVLPADRAAIRETIQAQLDAFRRDDGETAFGFASPTIQSLFGTPELFMQMVRQGYRPVYRPQVFEFRELVTLHGLVTQKVHVVGPDGRPVTAYYPMSQGPDGRWRIEGCYLQAPDEHQA
ncbi:MAG: DUF4864 domain-containing protein [Reyranella sp.]|jgi:hypothetical protein|uniref:DUF4864 domain-containing protein n=1 Tax=Reyranella sp. TaxID=1929291 RepID=UPI0025D5F509|nr:DUF4864 domain-containing protein [Reyranella sp.]MBR2815887.1 DUF4864 domain-containing protein [Reyranella sp.]